MLTPIHMPTKTKTFWNCMNRALKGNNKSHDGKRHILSIIAGQFTYAEIESNLKVSYKINILLLYYKIYII